MQHFVFHVDSIWIMKDKWQTNSEVSLRKILWIDLPEGKTIRLFAYFSSDMEEAMLDENVVVTLDDVQTIKMDFNPSIENTMWFA